MTQQIINIGSAPNDGTGDQLRVSFDKCNGNFTELYQGVAASASIGNAIEYQFNNNTTEPPSAGEIRFNQATQASTTKLWVSHTTAAGINIKQFLSAATTGAKLVLQDKNDNTNYIKFDVTGAPIDKTTYWEVSVAVTASGGNLPNARILAAVTAASGISEAPTDGQQYARQSASWTVVAGGGGGNVSNSGTPTNGQIAQWTDATHIQGVAASIITTGFAPLASPTFTGDPKAPTPTAGDNDTSIATTAFVTAADNAVKSQLIGSASSGMDTLGEIENYIAANITPTLANKADIFSPTFTGDPKAPTPTAGDNDTSIATTAFVAAAIAAIPGATTTVAAPQGRLTLQTGTPVMTTTQSAKTAIFYTPYVGNQISLFNGTSMVPTTFAELSVAITDTANSPAAIGSSKCNDWFVWDSGGGTLRLVHGPDWTDDTTRSAGTALVRVGGLLLNAVAITNGPAVQRGTYIGTTRSNASSQLDWIYGAVAANGTAGFFGVWNTYNRRCVMSICGDNTDSWTYSSATPRAANNSTTMRHSFVSGLAEDTFEGDYLGFSNGGTGGAICGICYDVTNAFSGRRGVFSGGTSGVNITCLPGNHVATALGFHFFQAGEASGAAVSANFIGDNGTVLLQSGLIFRGFM